MEDVERLFNPGFSGGHLTSLMPDFVKEVSIFCDILREHVEGGGRRNVHFEECHG